MRAGCRLSQPRVPELTSWTGTSLPQVAEDRRRFLLNYVQKVTTGVWRAGCALIASAVSGLG